MLETEKKTTKIGDFLRKIKAAISPDQKGILGIVGRILNNSDVLSKADKDYALKELETFQLENIEATKRWQADLSSRYWLPNNVRPLVLIYCWILFTIIVLSDLVNIQFLPLISNLMLSVNGMYFVGREVQKFRNLK